MTTTTGSPASPRPLLPPLNGVARGRIQHEMLATFIADPTTGFAPSHWDRTMTEESNTSRGWRAWIGMQTRLITALHPHGLTCDVTGRRDTWYVILLGLDAETLTTDLCMFPELRVPLAALNHVARPILGRDLEPTEAEAVHHLARHVPAARDENLLWLAAAVGGTY
ncbi:hypothetical protein [Actinotalea ferrariae]|nr:hypothetical protein [Actinotalea ferrariae]